MHQIAEIWIIATKLNQFTKDLLILLNTASYY